MLANVNNATKDFRNPDMAISEFEIKRIEKLVGTFVESKRPPAHVRERVDLSFRLTGQSVVIFEVRAERNDPSTNIELPVAKITYVKSTKEWKLYWMKSDMKWHGYKPFPISKSLESVLEAIGQDAYSCFWG